MQEKEFLRDLLVELVRQTRTAAPLVSTEIEITGQLRAVLDLLDRHSPVSRGSVRSAVNRSRAGRGPLVRVAARTRGIGGLHPEEYAAKERRKAERRRTKAARE